MASFRQSTRSTLLRFFHHCAAMTLTADGNYTSRLSDLIVRPAVRREHASPRARSAVLLATAIKRLLRRSDRGWFFSYRGVTQHAERLDDITHLHQVGTAWEQVANNVGGFG